MEKNTDTYIIYCLFVCVEIYYVCSQYYWLRKLINSDAGNTCQRELFYMYFRYILDWVVRR